MDSQEAEIVRYDSHLQYDYSEFDCGVESINNYFRENLSRDFKQSLSVPYLLVIDREIIGFFTLSSHAIEKKELKGAFKSNSSYRQVSVIIIGKLAVDVKYQGQGLGKVLSGKAIGISWRSSRDVGTRAVVLHAREGTEPFYKEAGFIQGKEDLSLFIYPLKQYENALRETCKSNLGVSISQRT